MPDYLRDEETETRTHSLCLFNVSGVSRNNRCENCPCAAGSRALYQQRRCPLDVGQNILGTVGVAAEGISESIDPKLLATSSKLQHGPDAVAKISHIIAGISLGDTPRKYARRSRSDLGINNPSVDMVVAVTHVDIGVKRKVDHEPEGSLRKCVYVLVPDRINELADVYTAHNGASHDQTEPVQNATSDELGVVSPRDESSDIGTERTQQNKRQKLSQGSDISLADVADLFNSLSICSDSSPVHTEDDHHSEGDISISVPQVDIGIEAKAADSLNRAELGGGVIPHKARVLTEVDVMRTFKDESSDVEHYFRNKPQNVFQDLQKDEPLFLGVYPAVPAPWSSLLNSFDSIMQEGHHSGRASSVDIRIPGIGMLTVGQGVPPCNDGIFDPCDPEEGSPMLAEEIFGLSIDQIEERRIDGSSFFST